MGHSDSHVVQEKDTILVGEHGTYIIGEMIAEGGNGKVFEVQVQSEQGLPESENGYVVKILSDNWKNDCQKRKRETRFAREIESVKSLYSHDLAIIPIFDFNLDAESGGKFWYLMPKAKAYNYSDNCHALGKLRDALQIGKTLRAVHKFGFFHRDIKPANLMVYGERLCLTDFGLVFNDEFEHITGENEGIGPGDIRPPEMEYGAKELRESVDYEKVDVYLFVKTIWLILTGNKRGFRGQYNRHDLSIYLNQKKMMLGDTLEPLHQMMEKATVYENKDRIDIASCVKLISTQIEIAEGRIDKNELEKFRFEECFEEAREQIPCDERVYNKLPGINMVLDKFAGAAWLIADDYGKKYPIGILKSSSYVKEYEEKTDEKSDEKRIVKLNLSFSGETRRIRVNVEKLAVSSNECVLSIISNSDWDSSINSIRKLSELQLNENEVLLNLSCRIYIEMSGEKYKNHFLFR